MLVLTYINSLTELTGCKESKIYKHNTMSYRAINACCIGLEKKGNVIGTSILERMKFA